MHRRRYEVGAGGSATVRGALLPRLRGRVVTVDGLVHRRWRVLARSRTQASGHFRVRVGIGELGAVSLRVRFAGDRRNGGVRARVGSLRRFRATLASWYALYGSPLACGGRLATNSSASRTRRCRVARSVTLRYHGREVTVPVIDRGPYVGGREYDLTGATARRLGFEGVGVVWSSR